MVLLAAFFVSQTCQKSQLRVSKETAIATAEHQIDFHPTRTQIRLLRQGLNARPYWIVSLSIPTTDSPSTAQVFKELAVVRVDANTGKVADVKVQR